MSPDWWEPLVRGVVALLLAGVVYLGARLRFHRKEGPGAGADIGLD